MNYAFMRYTDDERLLVFATVDTVAPDLRLRIPTDAARSAGIEADARYRITLCNLGQTFAFDETCRGADFSISGIRLRGTGTSAAVLKITKIE